MWGRPTRLQVTTALHVMESGPPENTSSIQLPSPDPALELTVIFTPGAGSPYMERDSGIIIYPQNYCCMYSLFTTTYSVLLAVT